MTKAMLRKELLQRRRSIVGRERQDAEYRIGQHLQKWLNDKGMQAIMGYTAIRGEVDISPLLDELEQRGLSVYLPKVVDKDHGVMVAVQMPRPWRAHLRVGAYGISEPVPDLADVDPSGLSAVLVPGVGFDRSMSRIGFGGGFYDRFLALLSQDTLKMGVAFETQILTSLASDPHDISLDGVCTENGIYVKE